MFSNSFAEREALLPPMENIRNSILTSVRSTTWLFTEQLVIKGINLFLRFLILRSVGEDLLVNLHFNVFGRPEVQLSQSVLLDGRERISHSAFQLCRSMRSKGKCNCSVKVINHDKFKIYPTESIITFDHL
jgi:hypothetical protein